MMRATARQQSPKSRDSSHKCFLVVLAVAILLSLSLPFLAQPANAAGVTIITHGYEWGADMPGWVTNMGNAVAARIQNGNLNDEVTWVTVTVLPDSANPTAGPLHLTSLITRPPSANNGEVIVLIDWSAVAGIWEGARDTITVASLLEPYLRTANWSPGGTPLAELPIHLIGHSRGGSLVVELARLLGQHGIWVDQVTTLDPHRVSILGWSDAYLNAYSNVLFQDNYYEQFNGVCMVADTTAPCGDYIAGSTNRFLPDIDLDTPGYKDPGDPKHSDTHLWYHGTIDLTTPVCDGSIGTEGTSYGCIYTLTRPVWYAPEENNGANVGFYFSRIAGGTLNGGTRPRGSDAGLRYDGAVRETATITAAGDDIWPNIEIVDFTDDITIGPNDTFHVNTYFSDANPNRTAQIEIGLDSDANPYNANPYTGKPYQILRSKSTASILTDNYGFAINNTLYNIPDGDYYVYAKISNSQHTRYYYAKGKLRVTAAPVTLTVDSTPQEGTSITLNKNDLNGNGNGSTPFTRSFGTGDQVQLTAPASDTAGRSFVEWRLNGVSYPSSRSIVVTLTAATAATAVYQPTSNNLLVNGSTTPDTVSLNVSQNTQQKVDILVQNTGQTSIVVPVSSSGELSAWITLPATSFTIPAGGNVLYEITISVPSNAEFRQYLGQVSFAGIALPIIVAVSNVTPGGNEWPLDTGSANIDGEQDSTVWFNTWTGTYDLNDSTQKNWAISPPITFDSAVGAQFDRLRSWDFNVTVRREDVSTSSERLSMWVNGNEASAVYPDGHTVGNEYQWTVNLYQNAVPGPNTFSLSTYSFVWNQGKTFWELTDFRFNWWNSITFSKSAWGGVKDFNSSDYSQIQAGFDRAQLRAHVDSVGTAGAIDLYDNGVYVSSRAVSSSDVGNDVTWSISRSQLKQNNRFSLRGNGSNQTKATLSNYRLYVSYFTGEPALQVSKSESADTVNVGDQVTVSVVIKNTGSNIARSPKVTDSALPAGLTLAQGSLSANFSNMRPGDTATNTYVINTVDLGSYVLAPALGTCQDLSQTKTYQGNSNPLSLEVWGGQLMPSAVVSLVDFGGGQKVAFSATVLSSLTQAPITDASVVSQVYKSINGYWVLQSTQLLGYNPVSGQYEGLSDTITDFGSFKACVVAQRDFYQAGTSADWLFDRCVYMVSAPSSLTASLVSPMQVKLTWQDNSHGAAGFRIERATSVDGHWTQIAQVLPNTTNLWNTGLFPSRNYYYRVRAYTCAVNSDYCDPAGVSTPDFCRTSVAGWGENYNGQTAPPDWLTGVVAIAAGGNHSLALMRDGTVGGWGDDNAGQATPPSDLSNVVAIAAGSWHSLALKGDGTVVGWGDDFSGQIDVPPGLSNVVAIAAGGGHSLALKSDGTVIAWGDDSYGQTDVPPGLNGVEAVAAGGAQSLALKSDGTVIGWGDDSYGQATGSPTGSSTNSGPVVVNGEVLSNVVAIAAGVEYGLALKGDGTVVGWGENSYAPPSWLTGVVAIDAHGYNSLALMSDGTVAGWPEYGEVAAPPPPGLMGVVAIAAGWYHGLAIVSEVSAGPALRAPSLLNATAVSPSQINLAWQDNSDNENGFEIERAASTDGPWTQIAQVSRNVTAYRNTGLFPSTAYYYRVRSYNCAGDSAYSDPVSATTVELCSLGVGGWGDNSDGQAAPHGLSNVVAIAAGDSHGLALISDGTVVQWGNNYWNELPSPPSDLSNVVAIAAGPGSSLALKSDGTVMGWGICGEGCYGAAPSDLSNVVAIASAAYNSLTLKSDGTVFSWNTYWGDAPAYLRGIVAITAGAYFSLALESDGTIVGWGDNQYGKATPPVGLSNVVAIAAGGGEYNGYGAYGLALKSDGTVVGWGYNLNGEATGSPTESEPYTDSGPVVINGNVLSNVVAIAAGDRHSLALLSDGSVIGWGDDSSGQIDVPPGLINVVAIAAGRDYSLVIACAPTAPSDLSATTVSPSEIDLSWTDNSNNEDGFEIERSTDGINFSEIDTVGPDVTSYQDTGLDPCTEYYYRVSGIVSVVNSGDSNTANAQTPGCVGALQVFIYPQCAIAGGAMWQLDGGDWQASGSTVSGLPVGPHIVHFNSLPTAASPLDQVVTIMEGQTDTLPGTYGLIDTDGDGIPDCWLQEYFGHPTGVVTDRSCATCDADGTGQNNLFKYVAGLDPTNPASVFLINILVDSPSLGIFLLNEQFSSDVFASGSWTRTDSSVTVDTINGWLQIASAGLGSAADKVIHIDLCPSNPVVIEQRLRLESGGGNYRLPWEAISFEDSSKLAVTYLPDLAPGDHFGWAFGGWTDNNYNGVPGTDYWAVIRIVLTSTAGELFVKPDDTGNGWFSNNFYSAASTNWSHSSIEKIEFSQPWDASCDIDYVTIQTFGLANTLVALQFNPAVTGRTYTPLFSTNLVSGVWLPLTTYAGVFTNGNQVTITDTNPIPPQEFYRIDITYP